MIKKAENTRINRLKNFFLYSRDIRRKIDIAQNLFEQKPDSFKDKVKWLSSSRYILQGIPFLQNSEKEKVKYEDNYHEIHDEHHLENNLDLEIASTRGQLECLIYLPSLLNKSTNLTEAPITELALFGANNEDHDKAKVEFEVKRAIFSSFASSWIFKLTILILLVSSGLFTLKFLELNETTNKIGIEVEQTLRAINIASKELSTAKIDLEEMSNKTELAAIKGIADLNNANRAIGILVLNSTKEIEEEKERAVLSLSKMQEKTIKEARLAISEQGSLLVESLNATANIEKDKLLNKIPLLHESIEKEVKQVQLLSTNQTAAQLEQHFSSQKKLLSDTTQQLNESLLLQQATAKSSVDSIIFTVKSTQDKWLLEQESQFASIEKKLKSYELKSEENIQNLIEFDTKYSNNLKLAIEASQIGEWIKKNPKSPLIVSVIDYRTWISLGALILSIVGWIVVFIKIKKK
jgi:hypothetical protein